jgi:putative spermidine/putrescine transport system substrate-binding protein
LIWKSGPQWLSQLQANPFRPPIDVLITVPDLALSAIEAGLTEKISAEKVPNLGQIPQPLTDALNGLGTVLDYGVAGITYDKDRIKQPPRSFAEFVERTARGEWTASVPGIACDVTPNMLIWPLATALGGSVDNVDPFFTASKKMKPNLVFWSGTNQFVSHLTSGEAAIGIFFDGTTWAQVDNGLTWMDFLNPQEGGSMNAITVQKIKNTSELG